MSRYFWVLFSSEKTLRIAAVEKILPKITESMIVEGISLGSDGTPGGIVLAQAKNRDDRRR